jgi:hypothetical protein
MEQLKALKEQRDSAWSYFQLHAGQRMATFNFFIVIAALLTTGLAGTFVKDFEFKEIGIILSSGLVIVSFTFWKLDQRVRFLIKHAESYLKEIEKKWNDAAGLSNFFLADLFSAEEMETEKKREKGIFRFWAWHLSYSQCFGIIYCLFGVLGLLGLVASLLK